MCRLLAINTVVVHFCLVPTTACLNVPTRALTHAHTTNARIPRTPTTHGLKNGSYFAADFADGMRVTWDPDEGAVHVTRGVVATSLRDDGSVVQVQSVRIVPFRAVLP